MLSNLTFNLNSVSLLWKKFILKAKAHPLFLNLTERVIDLRKEMTLTLGFYDIVTYSWSSLMSELCCWLSVWDLSNSSLTLDDSSPPL